jgi:hypothetical protein
VAQGKNFAMHPTFCFCDEGFLRLLFACSCRSITSDAEISSSLTSQTISVHSSGFSVRPNEVSGSPLALAVFRSTGTDHLSLLFFWFRSSSSVSLVLYSRKLLIYMDIWAISRRRARYPERILIFFPILFLIYGVARCAILIFVSRLL